LVEPARRAGGGAWEPWTRRGVGTRRPAGPVRRSGPRQV